MRLRTKNDLFSPLALFCCLLVFLPPAFADHPASRSSLAPGQTLRIDLNEGDWEAPRLYWGGASELLSLPLPAYKTSDNKWRIVSPVPVDVSTGHLALVVRDPGFLFFARKNKKFRFEVAHKEFGLETIRFPRDKARLLNDPAEDEESRLIRELFESLSQEEIRHWEGLFQKPVPNRVISPFGVSRKKIGQEELDFHRGVDLAGREGEPIRAPGGGKVLLAKDFQFHGQTAVLSHGQGVGTVYIHMSAISVKEGQRVRKGEEIGRVGSTGLSTGPHLHWGLYVHGQPVDPLQWIQEEF